MSNYTTDCQANLEKKAYQWGAVVPRESSRIPISIRDSIEDKSGMDDKTYINYPGQKCKHNGRTKSYEIQVSI